MPLENQSDPMRGISCGAGSAICSSAHGIARGDYIVMNGLRYRVTSVKDANSFTLRNARWYDMVLWHLKRTWKWITGFCRAVGMTNKAALPNARIASNFRAALFGLARGWASEFFQNQLLHPRARLTLANLPRVNDALGASELRGNLCRSKSINRFGELHNQSQKKTAQSARKDLRTTAQSAFCLAYET